MATSKTPKELAEEVAALALDAAIAALKVETEARAALRAARNHSAAATLEAERKVRDAEDRADAALTAWREAQKAVPH